MTRKRIAATISVTQLFRYFSTEEKCIAWLEQARWNGKPTCPHCQGQDHISVSESKRFTYWHRTCRKQFTVKTGTVMHSSKTPTQNWIVTLYYVLTARKGVSAMQLSKELGVQYRTAWYLLHRVREACASGQFKLTNVVEVDETYIGGKEKNKHQSQKPKKLRGTTGKQAVLGMRERDGKTKAKPVTGTDRELCGMRLNRTSKKAVHSTPTITGPIEDWTCRITIIKSSIIQPNNTLTGWPIRTG